ncbi:hypothetical protein D3C72_1234810 [compost metagenome]
MCHRQQGHTDIGLHRIPQPHALVGRQVHKQAVGQWGRGYLRHEALLLRIRFISRMVRRVVARRVVVPWWRRSRRRIFRPDQTAFETGEPVMAEHDHNPGPRPRLGRVAIFRAEGLQGLIDCLKAGVDLRRQNFLHIRLRDQAVIFLGQGRHRRRVRL